MKLKCLYCNKDLNNLFDNKNNKWFLNHVGIPYNIFCHYCEVLYSIQFIQNNKEIIPKLNIIEYMTNITNNELFNTSLNGDSKAFLYGNIIKLPNWFLITNNIRSKCLDVIKYQFFI